MAKDAVVIRFENVSFDYGPHKQTLDDVSFSVRTKSKITLMGQNGAGKSTLFGLITGDLEPTEGRILREHGATVAIARQVIPRTHLDMTVREFFQSGFKEKIYDIDPRIKKVLEAVNFDTPYDRIVRTFSGGQQARLLLASALILEPDILLLDEPTNNLDHAGIEHLTQFLVDYSKTVIVISHDADFLNKFTQGVLYLDVYTKKIEQYVGNYNDVLKDITARVEKENMKNAQLKKEIIAKKEKANEFAYKGGQMRMVAKRMREKAEELEEEIVDVRKEDRTIRPFVIPSQETLSGEIITLSSLTIFKNHTPEKKAVNKSLRKNTHLLLKGPNGIGKSTLLERITKGDADGVKIASGVRVGYYRQDFSNIDFEQSSFEVLKEAMIKGGEKFDEQKMRAVAAAFLIIGDMIHAKVGSLSEGQKGLLAFARLVLEKPGLLVLDEPTNHINFRHIPVIAEALNKFGGTMILVSHVPEFVEKIRIDETLDLGK
ncbi:MAG TPA: ATP-binding cassette domain-containing protein [Candidatus Paceibacterota bacterium]